METKNTKKVTQIVVLALACLVLYSLTAGGGSLEPPSAPGSTMPSLDEVSSLGKAMGHPAGFLTGAGKGPTDIFVQVQGVDGESIDPAHEDWIDAMWFNSKLSKPLEEDGGAHGSGPPAEFSEVTIVKYVDAATPPLLLCCADYTLIPSVVIEFCQKAGAKRIYLRITLTAARITSVEPVTLSSSTRLEVVSFRDFRTIRWEYFFYDNGGPPLIFEAGWDLEMDRPI